MNLALKILCTTHGSHSINVSFTPLRQTLSDGSSALSFSESRLIHAGDLHFLPSPTAGLSSVSLPQTNESMQSKEEKMNEYSLFGIVSC